MSESQLMTESSYKLRLKVLDDEPEICRYVCAVAESLDFDSHTPESPVSFMEDYSADTDVIMLDLYMPGVDGVELLRFMANNAPPKSIILMSGGDEVVLKSAQKLAEELGLNVIDVLRKPIRKRALESALLRVPKINTNHTLAPASQASPTLGELSSALSNDEIEVVFQPQIQCSGHKLVGLEALARWSHPRLGNVPPLEFIAMAEKAGLVAQLDRQVMRKAICQMAQFNESNESLRLSVNMSAHTFNDLELPEIVVGMLDDCGLKPESLSIEVTETAVMRDLVKSLDIFTRLRMKGVSLSIDDFGTGYSSMSQLVRIPFSELKIDGSFVESAYRDRECRAVVRASALLAKELGMTVVAEGVSSRAALTLVAELGCDLAQGYFTGRPLPPKSILELLGPNFGVGAAAAG